ncbi:transcriptional regulator BolA [Simiduia litorea]|uniref:BolA family protein n=1 Tax=Simiduia litorea TaxID=1435348 RepID=UPI0036F38537
MRKQDIIVGLLTEALAPLHLSVENESHMHNVPPGSESHFKVQIVSAAFSGKRMVQQHQLVYVAMGDMMAEIHALALHTLAPDQWHGQAAGASPNCLGGSKAS